MEQRSLEYFLTARWRVFRQPVLPISSGLSGPPSRFRTGGMASPDAVSRTGGSCVRPAGPVRAAR